MVGRKEEKEEERGKVGEKEVSRVEVKRRKLEKGF